MPFPDYFRMIASTSTNGICQYWNSVPLLFMFDAVTNHVKMISTLVSHSCLLSYIFSSSISAHVFPLTEPFIPLANDINIHTVWSPPNRLWKQSCVAWCYILQPDVPPFPLSHSGFFTDIYWCPLSFSGMKSQWVVVFLSRTRVSFPNPPNVSLLFQILCWNFLMPSLVFRNNLFLKTGGTPTTNRRVSPSQL